MPSHTLECLQRDAVIMAEKQSFLVIRGPPGTGKSTTIGALALILSIRENHKIILSCPTNVACDVVAQKIMELAECFTVPVNVIRIHSARHNVDK